MKIHQQVRRPLVGLALSMAGGLALQRALPLPVLFLLGGSACVLSLLAGIPRLRSSAGMYMGVLLLAASYGAVESVQTPARAVLPIAEELTSSQNIIGRVVGDPDRDEGVTFFRFHVDAVRLHEGWRRADLSIQVHVRDLDRVPAYGERWRLAGRFRSYERAFSGLHGALYGDGENAGCIQSAPRSLLRACYHMRRRAAAILQRGLEESPRQARLLRALLLGYRRELPESLRQLFSRTGTLHIFAISGLHVGVMAAILIGVLKVLGISRPRWGLFLIPLLFVYVLSTGMKPSAFRAFTMAAVYFAAPLIGRRSDTASAIAVAAIILLLIHPLQLADPGVLLSFTVVCGIVLLHSFVALRIRVLRLSGRGAWFKAGGRSPLSSFGRVVALLALTSLAAWLFSAPLTARFFNTFSPVALIGNLLIIPLTFLIVLTGCLSLLAAPVSWALVFNHANRVFVTFLIAVIERVSSVPGAYRYVAAPSAWGVACWYGGLVACCAGTSRARRVGFVAIGCAVVIWGAGMLPIAAHPGVEVLRDTDMCVLVQGRASSPVLVVQGDAYSLTRAGRLLRKNGINRLAVLAVAESRVDPSAIQELCRTYSVAQVRMTPEAASACEALDAMPITVADRLVWPIGEGVVSVELAR